MPIDNNSGKLFVRIASHALLVGFEEIPLVGAVVKIGRECWQVLHNAQEAIAQNERIAQLEQAAALSPDAAQQIAQHVIQQARNKGYAVEPARADAVEDVIAVLPASIRERTRATLTHARRLGTEAATVLPVTSQFSVADREAFYTGLFPQRRPQFRGGDTIPHGNPEQRLERLLGAGNFGEVWLVRHRSLPDIPPWAVKFCQDDKSAAVLIREAQNLYALRQKLPAGTPHIVALLDLQLTTMPYWLAFEYITGGTLESRMRLGPMTWPQAWNLFQPLLDGMAAVHELNIVHRDLKPANILLDAQQLPRIADFGIGKVLAEHGVTTRRTAHGFTAVGYGTFGYMSPEQAAGQPAHAADDVYALGVILWQMLAGQLKPLHYERDLNTLNIPEAVRKAIHDSVFEPREQRIIQAQVLKQRLAAVVDQPVKLTQPRSANTLVVPQSTGKLPNDVVVTSAIIAVNTPGVNPTKSIGTFIFLMITTGLLLLIGLVILKNMEHQLARSLYSVSSKDPTTTPNDTPPQSPLPPVEVPTTTSDATPPEPDLPLVGDPTAHTRITPVVTANHPLISERYVDNQDGTITDIQTQLIWKRCAEGQIWTGSACLGLSSQMKWRTAMPNEQQTTWPDFAGRSDWRVPTKEELLTLVYCSSGKPQTVNNTGIQCAGEYQHPTIDKTAFPNAPLSWFWTASSNAYGSSGSWVIFFYGGYADYYFRDRRSALRLVCGGQ